MGREARRDLRGAAMNEVAEARCKPFSNPKREVQPVLHVGGSGGERIELLSALVPRADMMRRTGGM